MDLDKIKQEIISFVDERDWDQFHSVKNLSMALTKESAELMEIFQWMSEAESNVIKGNTEKMKKVEAEVADVFVYLLRICLKTDIDLEAAVIKKMKANAEKYPVEKARGNCKKYDEF